MTCLDAGVGGDAPIGGPFVRKLVPAASDAELLLRPRHDDVDPTAQEQLFDDLLRLACDICGATSGVIILVEESWVLVKGRVGMDGRAPLYHEALAKGIIESPERPLVMVDTATDAGFAAQRLDPGIAPFRFCAGAVLADAQGAALGVLCVLDGQVRDLDSFQRNALISLARQASSLLTLARSNRQLRDELAQSAQHQRQLHEYQRLLELRNDQLSIQMRLDVLTGLANRRAFACALEAAVHEAQAQSRPLAMAVADIDHFKAINDTHGHPVGDRVLVQVAQILQATMDGQALAARQGGEEFVLLLPMHSLTEAVQRCEDIQARLRSSALDAPVTLSIGVVAWQPGESAEQLYARADAALYLAKRGGRDRVVQAL